MRVNLTIHKLDWVRNKGWFSGSKLKLGEILARTSIDNEDISHLVEVRDDFGTPYTQAFLEYESPMYDSEYSEEGEFGYYLVLSGTLEQNQNVITKEIG